MSVSPLQNFLNPPPVPEIATVTFTPGLAFWNSSATASLMGPTVLEPSTLTVPLRGAAVADAIAVGLAEPVLEQAARTIAALNARTPGRLEVVLVNSIRSSLFADDLSARPDCGHDSSAV